jgi:hypothetical protein
MEKYSKSQFESLGSKTEKDYEKESGLPRIEEKPSEYKRAQLREKDKIILEKLEREVKMIAKNPDLAKEAQKKMEEIRAAGAKEELKRLVDLAEDKGVIFAVKVAEDMNDPYILDLFRDVLAREGFYNNFEK